MDARSARPLVVWNDTVNQTLIIAFAATPRSCRRDMSWFFHVRLVERHCTDVPPITTSHFRSARGASRQPGEMEVGSQCHGVERRNGGRAHALSDCKLGGRAQFHHPGLRGCQACNTFQGMDQQLTLTPISLILESPSSLLHKPRETSTSSYTSRPTSAAFRPTNFGRTPALSHAYIYHATAEHRHQGTASFSTACSLQRHAMPSGAVDLTTRSPRTNLLPFISQPPPPRSSRQCPPAPKPHLLSSSKSPQSPVSNAPSPFLPG